MRDNKGYIITLRNAVVGNELLKDLISSKYYIPSRNLPLILYKNKEQFDEIDTAVCPAFRMHGFLILNFNKNEEGLISNFVKTRLNKDDFIKHAFKKNEIIDAEEISFKVVEKLIKEVNEILELELKKEDIFKISEIKVMLKEEKMAYKTSSVRIFIASPGDVSMDREKTKDIVSEIKRESRISKKLGIQCETFDWENSTGKKKFGSLQEMMNNSISEYNIYVVILWKCFITRLEDTGSKIEEELKKILNNYQNNEPSKFWLMFYFRESAIPQSEIIKEHVYKQFLQLAQFKSEAQKKGISTTYNDDKEFKNKFGEYIVSILNKIGPPVKLSINVKRDKEFKSKYLKSVEKDIKEYQISDQFKHYIELNALDFKDMPMGRLIHAVDVHIESGKPVAIIGEFGSGKTIFTRYYEYKKKYEWLENPHKSRMVQFLDLNEYSRKRYTMTMINWILENIKHKIGFDMSRKEFEEYLDEKSIILIFDGLDGVANIPGEDAINKNIRNIIRISHSAVPLIITSREAFLESEVDPRNLRNFARVYIDKLDIHQIIDFVRTMIPENWQDFIEFVFGAEPDLSHVFDRQEEDKSGVLELVRKPLFLHMMIRAYQKGDLRNINTTADLYEVLTGEWIREEIEKKETSIRSEEMRQIIQELAFKMLLDNQFSYTHEELKKIIHNILDKISDNLKQNFDYDAVLKDITNASFLVRDKTGKNNFAFPHRSFNEYFVAYKLALELKERNTENFSIRIFYEEIFEFLSWIMTEKSGKDEDLIAVLGNPQFHFKARVNAIPPLRKQKNKKAIGPLLRAHTDTESGYPLLRFVCGYTLAIFQEMFPEEFKTQEVKEQLSEAYKKEKNSLIRLRLALLLTEGEYMQYDELSPDYKFFASSLDEILAPSGTIEAYDKILKVNREHPIVLEESIRVLSIYVMFNAEALNYKSTLIRYIFGHNHTNERIRRICLWSIDKLGLLEPKDKKRETLENKKKSNKFVRKSLKDANSSVVAIAQSIIAKYPGQFLIQYEDNQ